MKKKEIMQQIAENAKIHASKEGSIMNLYVIKDTMVGFGNAPFPSDNDETAKRLFAHLAQETSDNLVNTFPECKELWKVGFMDRNTGIIVPDVKFLDRASGYQRKVPVQQVNMNEVIMRQKLAAEQAKEQQLKNEARVQAGVNYVNILEEEK